jgi:hypothetical protein
VQATKPVSTLDIGATYQHVTVGRAAHLRERAARTGRQSRYVATACLFDTLVDLYAAAALMLPSIPGCSFQASV